MEGSTGVASVSVFSKSMKTRMAPGLDLSRRVVVVSSSLFGSFFSTFFVALVVRTLSVRGFSARALSLSFEPSGASTVDEDWDFVCLCGLEDEIS